MKALSSFLLIFCLSIPALALEVPPITSRVTDQVGIVSSVENQLEQMLLAHEQATGQQFALLIIPTLNGDPLEDFSMRVVEKWQLGQKDTDKGLLLLIATQDRKMRFEVGYGLEGDIPDALAGRVIRNVLVPAFRADNFGPGIIEAFEIMIQAGGGKTVAVEPPPSYEYSNESSSPEDLELSDILIFLLIIFVLIVSKMMGWSSGYSSGYSSGGGFSGGGGGFSGGGGSFGGGGASGGW